MTSERIHPLSKAAWIACPITALCFFTVEVLSPLLSLYRRYELISFDDIPEEVFSFSAKAAGQNYWLAKAFIVLGDTYAERGELTQARATFESIRDGYTAEGPQDDVLDQVELRLRKLQK